MGSVTEHMAGMTVTAHLGDCKTLLAFDFDDPRKAENLAGFTIRCKPGSLAPYYLWNTLQFEHPAAHHQDPSEPPQSTLNAPVHKFRWLHVPGQVHQGTHPFFGRYEYTVTPRYFDAQGGMKALDPGLSVTLGVDVGPFKASGIELGFTRGYVQSQAFAHQFGKDALLRPKNEALIFDTSAKAGTNGAGQAYTFADEYGWLGFTARAKVIAFLDEVIADKKQYLNAFCYDLNDPDVCSRLLKLAAAGRVRILLDNADLHTSTPAKPAADGHKAKKAKAAPEDVFEKEFKKVAKEPAAILRWKFKRYAHDKVFVSFTREKCLRVLTGSTNFSITGFCVNSNHVLVLDDHEVVRTYGELFEAVWASNADTKTYMKTRFPNLVFTPAGAALPRMQITFAPHQPPFAQKILGDVAARIAAENTQPHNRSVLFAVMEIGKGVSAVLKSLQGIHQNSQVLSLGISDTQDGTALYTPGASQGILVTGKPRSSILPPPFDQIRFVSGVGHQIHHKFVICGFNGPDPTVFCGSSNLAEGGESSNGDNLLEIHDRDIATAFAVEAVALVDHFHYLNVLGEKDPTAKDVATGKIEAIPQSKQQAAKDAKWFLSTGDGWTKPYFDSQDLRCVERKVFAGASSAPAALKKAA